jgi:hypothetical protein
VEHRRVQRITIIAAAMTASIGAAMVARCKGLLPQEDKPRAGRREYGFLMMERMFNPFAGRPFARGQIPLILVKSSVCGPAIMGHDES